MKTQLAVPQKVNPPIFGPCMLWLNALYGGRPRPRFPLPKMRRSHKIFGPCLLWPNGWMDQDGTWQGGRPRPRRHCATWGPNSPPQKGQRPQFSAHCDCGQAAGCIKMPLGMEIGLSPGYFVLDGDPAPSLPQKGQSPNFPPTSIVA